MQSGCLHELRRAENPSFLIQVRAGLGANGHQTKRGKNIDVGNAGPQREIAIKISVAFGY
jgi:hypothetical protein